MTIIKSLIYTILLTACFNLSAQQQLDQGSIVIELTDISAEDEQMAAGLEMMKGSTTSYFFDKENSLMTMDMMGGMVKTQILTDSEENSTMLFDMMGNKSLVESTKAEREKLQEAPSPEDIEVTYDENDTKEIHGYKCIKATIVNNTEESMGMNFTLYVTEEIKASNKMIQGINNTGLKGFPLEYIIGNDQMSMTYTATEVSNEVDSKKFALKKAGYTKMSLEEFMEQMQAMGAGGMGF